MNIRQTLLFGALVTLLSASCFAITSTENAALFKGDDSRLDQRVTCSADGLPIAAVLGQLSRSTGVEMNAGIDKDDWMVRDRKVIVHVRDMKLVTLMQELASILRFHWSRGGDEGKWTYRLWQDAQQRAEEESLRAAEENAQTKQAREKRENGLADIVNLASLDASDAVGLKTTDPWRYILATEPLGRDVADFFGSFPEARNAFVQGTEASFPVSQLPPNLQETVRRIAQSYDGLAQKIGASEDHAMLLDSFDRLQVTVNRRTYGRDDLLSRSLLGRITIGSETESFDIPLFDPASAMAEALGTAIVSLQAGVSREAVGKQLQLDMQSAQAAEEVTQDSSRDISSDPALRERTKLFDEPTIAPLTMILGALADKTRLNIISDYFPGLLPTIPGGEKKLGEQLEIIRKEYGCNWEKAGRTLRFRDREWYNKRGWEVPEVWIRYWIERGKINNGLKLQDLVQIASLRDEQIDHTIMKNQDLVRFGAGDAARNRQILQFYGILDRSQQKAMVDTHLPVSSLNESQWAGLQKALAAKGAVYAAAEKGSQFLRLTQSGTDIVTYEFSYYPGENQPPLVFTVASGVVYSTPDEVPVPPPDEKPN